MQVQMQVLHGLALDEGGREVTGVSGLKGGTTPPIDNR